MSTLLSALSTFVSLPRQRRGSACHKGPGQRCGAPDNVLVVGHLLQEHDLPKGPLRIRRILKRIEDLLQRHRLPAVQRHAPGQARRPEMVNGRV